VYRILFIFAKTHRGIGYVQGMNEVRNLNRNSALTEDSSFMWCTQLVAPLFYVFGTEKGVDIKDAEADTFFCFANLMGEVLGREAPVFSEFQ
jgi:Rab-GTPase-TBC domain